MHEPTQRHGDLSTSDSPLCLCNMYSMLFADSVVRPNPTPRNECSSRPLPPHSSQWLGLCAPLRSSEIDIKSLSCPHCPSQPSPICVLKFVENEKQHFIFVFYFCLIGFAMATVEDYIWMGEAVISHAEWCQWCRHERAHWWMRREGQNGRPLSYIFHSQKYSTRHKRNHVRNPTHMW